MPAPSDAPVVTVVAWADREGAAGNRRWAEVFADRYLDHLEGRAAPLLRIVPVAHLKGVPFFVRAMVRSGFRGHDGNGEPILAIGLDWKGRVAGQLGLSPGVPNLAVFDPEGRLRARTAGDVDCDEADPLLAALDDLLLKGTEPAR